MADDDVTVVLDVTPITRPITAQGAQRLVMHRLIAISRATVTLAARVLTHIAEMYGRHEEWEDARTELIGELNRRHDALRRLLCEPWPDGTRDAIVEEMEKRYANLKRLLAEPWPRADNW